MQYGINPYCFILIAFSYIASYTKMHVLLFCTIATYCKRKRYSHTQCVYNVYIAIQLASWPYLLLNYVLMSYITNYLGAWQ